MCVREAMSSKTSLCGMVLCVLPIVGECFVYFVSELFRMANCTYVHVLSLFRLLSQNHDILILLKFFWKSYTSEHTQTMIRGIYREISNAVRTGLIYQKHKRLFSNAP